MEVGVCETCGDECLPFDLHCDECSPLIYKVTGECHKINIQQAIVDLGYNFKPYDCGFGDYIQVKINRCDHKSMVDILDEIK